MSSPPRMPPALEAAAASLRARYAGRHPADVVERCLLEAYQRLASTARVQDFVPIFAERSARQRLDAGGEIALEGQAQSPVRRRAAPARRRAAAAGSE
ncbi:MAG: hypothetical protein QOE72_131 [Chloroflexota bacterium]|jgi:hypothetical protein|nr:hypothetical protein [Chloroflexota bacterium]